MKNGPNSVCLDFDGTIMRYEDPPDHFHPVIIEALNHFGENGVPWIANSGRSFEGQEEIIRHCVAERGLVHTPVAIISCESYIHVPNGNGYAPLAPWNEEAARQAKQVNGTLQAVCKQQLDDLTKRHDVAAVYLREDGTVFQVTSPEEARAAFIIDFQRLVDEVPGAQLINNGEWIAVVHERLGKGNTLRAFLEHARIDPDSVLAVGDHGNDISMLDGSVTPHVACPGNAFTPVRDAVRAAGGYVAEAHGPHGTLEAFHHFFRHAIPWPVLNA